MSSYHDNKYDEIKSLVKKSRLLFEQNMSRVNIGKSIEDDIQDDEYETANTDKEKEEKKDERVEKYRISGNILAIHGEEPDELQITTDDKLAFQETIDEFTDEVSDLADFNQLNLYRNNVEWSGKIIDKDMDFIFTIGESNGIYINADAVKVDPEFLETINKLQKYYEKFKSKWSKLIAQRKISGQEEND